MSIKKVSLIVIASIITTSAILQLGCRPQKSVDLEENARIKATRTYIATIESAVTIYEIRTGKFPSSLDDLTQSIGGKPPLINPSQVNDKWGTKFRYKNEGGGYFEIRSAGPDTQFNTVDDIFNSKSKANCVDLKENARIQATRTYIATIESAVTIYEIRTGKFPSSLDDLTQSIGGKPPLINPSQVNDKWGTKYSYKNEGDGYFEIRSAGPDTQFNTVDDIFNSKSKANCGR